MRGNHRGAIIAVLALTTVLSGCSKNPAPQTSGPPTLPADGHMPTTTTPLAGRPTLTGSLEQIAGSKIYFTIQNDECSYPDKALVRSDTKTVTITIYGTEPSDSPCSAVGYTSKVWVDLGESIDNRKVSIQ